MTRDPSFGDQVRAFKAKVARVVPGLTEDDVRAILGEPWATHERADKPTPTDALQGLGSMFRFEDAGSETIWTFRDPARPRFRACVGFKAGRVCACWREVVSE